MVHEGDFEERLDRLRELSEAELSSNGAGASAAEVDWLLYRSFPHGEVSPEEFARIFPGLVRVVGLRSTRFDFELLYVRTLELAGALGSDALRSLSRTVANRLARGAFEQGGFDPADALSAVRFLARTLTAEDGSLREILAGGDFAETLFRITVDFVLDERELPEYLALSYLRDDDVDTGEVLASFRVPPARYEALARIFDGEACRTRLESGWLVFPAEAERAALAQLLRERIPALVLAPHS